MPSRLLIVTDRTGALDLATIAGAEVCELTQAYESASEFISRKLSSGQWSHVIRVSVEERLSKESASALWRVAKDGNADLTIGTLQLADGRISSLPSSRLRHAMRVGNAVPVASVISRSLWDTAKGLRKYEFEGTAWWDFALRALHAGIRVEHCAEAMIQKNVAPQDTPKLLAWYDLAKLIRNNPDAFERRQRLWADLLVNDREQGLSAQHCASVLQLSLPRLLDWDGWYSAALMYALQKDQEQILAGLGANQAIEWTRNVMRLRAFVGTIHFERPLSEKGSGSRRRENRCYGIDIRPLSVPSTRNRGIGRFVISTLRAMLAQNNDARFVLLGEHDSLDSTAIEDVTQHQQVTYRPYAAGCDEGLDCFLLTDPSPVMRGRQTKQLPVTSCPWAAIVYDLIPLEFPEQYLAADFELLDDYLDNLKTLSKRCRAYFPISNYVGEQLTMRMGISAEAITPIYGGSWQTNWNHGQAPELTNAFPYFLYVGGADARKNLVRLVAAFAHFLDTTQSDARLLLAGEVTEEKARMMLSKMSLSHLDDRVIGLGGVNDSALEQLYCGAIATVFVSLSEGLGLPALEAMACKCPVIGSNNSALAETIGDAGLLVNPNSVQEISAAMKRLAESDSLRSELTEKGVSRAREWTWERVAERLLRGLSELSWSEEQFNAPARKLRVAMLNRMNVWKAPGGDGEVMKQMREAAATRDIDIQFRESLRSGRAPDIAHFVNLTLAKRLDEVAEEAQEIRAPFVITTLFEDWPLYMRASQETSAILMEYVHGRLERNECDKLLEHRAVHSEVSHAGSSRAVKQAAAFLACGDSEAERLAQAYPLAAGRIKVVPFAVRNITEFDESAAMQIREKLDMERFVLCCGRLETRKNQLMLLKALEDSDIGVVFGAGGFTPQPAYAEAVRNFSRKGRTIILGRLERRSLDGLMRAASVHALPSFYELPGLVHLEAAAAGIPIVAATWGAITDYIPESLFFACEPDSQQSIRDAVTQALSVNSGPALGDYARSYTMERLAENLLQTYEFALSSGHKVRARANRTIVY